MNSFLHIHPNDNVFVALDTLAAGTRVQGDGYDVTALEEIPKGHKIAVKDIAEGENIIKYGFPIGHATTAIPAGSWIHTHNLKTNLSGMLEYTYEPNLSAYPEFPEGKDATFDGYVRKNGDVGIRNEIWIVNTVGCVNQSSEVLAREATKLYGDKVDGIYAFTHPFGCSQLGEDHKNTQQVLADLVHHPNAGGVLVLSLGCENNNLSEFTKVLGDVDPERVRFLVTQDVEDEIEAGLKILGELVEYASQFKRTPCPVSKLKVGLKCGGSDGFSGITGNPLVGAFSDLLGASGGTTVLTEVPEMFGAETILMNHCQDEETFQKTVNLINNFKDYYIRHNQVVYENPSPGNKKGGITTLEEKSLGCTQKGGRGVVRDVLTYGERLKTPGLNLLQGPGNDIVACTSLTSAGVHMILFTTGRGTPLGAPVPTVKVATNSALAEHKANWIDYNAGQLLEGKTMDEVSKDFFRYILDVASGKKTRNEINGYREISIFKDGVVL